MERKRKLPMGIEDFGRIRRDGFYYVDKTGMIRDLLENIALVNLFTRPRRFGKTLNMSMLKYFFETSSDTMQSDIMPFDRIDEYDVPLNYAYRSGYYDSMVGLVRALFGAVFKTNDSLEFAVLTGCLRISKESNVSASAETSEKLPLEPAVYNRIPDTGWS